MDRSVTQVMDHEINCLETKIFEHNRANPRTYFTSEEEEEKYQETYSQQKQQHPLNINSINFNDDEDILPMTSNRGVPMI